jgi:hypothetical protein
MQAFFNRTIAYDTSFDENDNTDMMEVITDIPDNDDNGADYPIKKLQGSFEDAASKRSTSSGLSGSLDNSSGMKVYLRVRPSSGAKAESTVHVISDVAIKTIAPQMSKRAQYTKTEERKYVCRI